MKKAILLMISILSTVRSQLDMSSDKMDFEDNIAEESLSNEQIITNSIVAKPILNDGKPFYVARDPTTGTLDFNIKKTVGIQNDIATSGKDGIAENKKSGHDINSLGHNNFHDYLNLPVKYSSSKFVYPLISGSYANLKYQGNNNNHLSNHKNVSTTIGTSTPKYFTHITNQVNNIFTATFRVPEIRHETTDAPVVRITSRRPTTTTTTTQAPTTETTTEKISTTPSTSATSSFSSVATTQSTSSVKYSSTIVQNSFPSTFKNKYIDSSETRKKTTAPVKVTESSTLPPNPIKFLDDLLEIVENRKETKATTYRPVTTHLSFTPSMPKPSAFKPMPTESQRNSSQKIVFDEGSKNPSVMTLSEIINSFSDKQPDRTPYETAEPSQTETNSLSTKPLQQANEHITLQQKLQKTQQQAQPQSVNVPPYQQVNFAPPFHNQVPNQQFEDYVEFENPDDQYASQYVKYEVQKPNTNLVKFQQIPSMNNVVISPDQNSASFVLGSQQSVGMVGVGNSLGVGSSHFTDNKGPMKVGQVINDDPPVRLNTNGNQVQGSIRFPSDSDQSFDKTQIVRGTIKLDGSSEIVQPPQALHNPMPSDKPVVFPSNEQKLGYDTMNAELSYGQPAATPKNPSQIIFENVNDIYEKINDKKQKQEIISNDLPNNIPAGDLTPSRVLTPPSPNQQRPFNKQQSHGPHHGPSHGPHRLSGLPNILPQFRPNSKASQGHPSMFKDVGAIRIPLPGPNRQYSSPVSLPKVGLPPMLPPHNQNLNFRRIQNRPYAPRPNRPQPPQQPSFDQNNDNGNRRVFRVGPGPRPPQHIIDQFQSQMNDRVFMKPPPPMNPPGFRMKQPNNRAPETMQMQQRPSNIPQSSQSPPPPDSELNKSPSPPVVQQYAPQRIESENEGNSTNLEPVITLQMLQNKKSGSKVNLPPVPHDIPQDIQAPLPMNHKDDKSKTPSIYVVYPVSSNSYENAAPLTSHTNIEDQPVGGHGDYHLSGYSEYQNTPFSVVSHFEQEPLLMKKDKKKNQFPYHLEKPSPNDFKFERPKYGPLYDEQARVVNKKPIFLENPDAAISSTLTRVTDKPIAIAYTPTEKNFPPVTNFYQYAHPAHHYDPQLADKYSVPNYGGPVISEIIGEKYVGFDYYNRQQQLQQHLNNGEDLDFYKEHYDFQAPFQASVSVNPEVTNPYEGWSIVTQSTDTNKIDRADLHLVDSSEETTTRKFDPNEFQPVFESGFQPIYSGKVSTAPELILESSEHPTTHSLTYATQPSTTTLPSTSAETTISLESTTSEEVTKKAEKKEIDSLEAFFESLTRDYDDDDSGSKSENESSSHRSL